MISDFFKRQFCDAHTCKKKMKIYPRGSGVFNLNTPFFRSWFENIAEQYLFLEYELFLLAFTYLSTYG